MPLPQVEGLARKAIGSHWIPSGHQSHFKM
jgi:hypothetical protein